MLGEDSVDFFGRSATGKMMVSHQEDKKYGSGGDHGGKCDDIDAVVKACVASDTIERKEIELKKAKNRQEVGERWGVVDVQVPCDGADNLIGGVRNFKHAFVQMLEEAERGNEIQPRRELVTQ
jgi:hypothetical protein